jgi:hypothetical protein
MSPETKIDLHGIEKQPFLDWSEQETYVEAVTIKTLEEAVAFLAEDMAVEPEELNVRPIHMRWVENEGKEAWTDIDGREYREGWLECDARLRDAVPFWKDCI